MVQKDRLFVAENQLPVKLSAKPDFWVGLNLFLSMWTESVSPPSGSLPHLRFFNETHGFRSRAGVRRR